MNDWRNRTYVGTPATAPGPAGPRMVRETLAIRRDPLGFLTTMRDEFGDIVQFPIPRPATYLIGSAEGADRVLRGAARGYGKDTIQYRTLALITGDGLLATADDEWRIQRPMLQPAFHHDTLTEVREVVRAETDDLIRRWRASGRATVVDVDAAMARLTLGVIGTCLFGDPLHARSGLLAEATLRALDAVVAQAQMPLPIPSAWPTRSNRRLGTALNELDSAVADIVSGFRRPGNTGSAPTPFLRALLSSGWSDAEVRDQIVTFLVAGHETAASALTWALWLVAGHPELADQDHSAAAIADETLRLYPPAWVITREALAPDRIGGFEIPAGSLLIISPYLIQRDPRYWPEPDVFHPGRFRSAPGRNTHYLPFGAGPRLCIGRDFARVEMSTVLEGLMQAFTFSRVAGRSPRPLPRVTLRPDTGVLLGLGPRHP